MARIGRNIYSFSLTGGYEKIQCRLGSWSKLSNLSETSNILPPSVFQKGKENLRR
jgi:hypothetical protein